jgi:ribosomal protein S27AE
MRKNKIHRDDVMASLNTACPSCGYSIPPGEILRVSTEEMKCPKCGRVFVAGMTRER